MMRSVDGLVSLVQGSSSSLCGILDVHLQAMQLAVRLHCLLGCKGLLLCRGRHGQHALASFPSVVDDSWLLSSSRSAAHAVKLR